MDEKTNNKLDDMDTSNWCPSCMATIDVMQPCPHCGHELHKNGGSLL